MQQKVFTITASTSGLSVFDAVAMLKAAGCDVVKWVISNGVMQLQGVKSE